MLCDATGWRGISIAVSSRPRKGTAQIAVEISFKPWCHVDERRSKCLFYGVCGQKLPSTETGVIFDVYTRGKGVTFLVAMSPEKLPNSLFFDAWSIPGLEITA
jgi:hypothetical protein